MNSGERERERESSADARYSWAIRDRDLRALGCADAMIGAQLVDCSKLLQVNNGETTWNGEGQKANPVARVRWRLETTGENVAACVFVFCSDSIRCFKTLRRNARKGVGKIRTILLKGRANPWGNPAHCSRRLQR